MDLTSKFVQTGPIMDQRRTPTGTVNDEEAAVPQFIPNIYFVQQISADSDVIPVSVP